MAKLKMNLDELKKELIVLKYTRKITKDDLRLPEWVEMHEDYREITAATDKAVLSIKNAILFQRRAVFCLTREATRELVTNDRNWKSKAGLSNDNWPVIIKLLVDVGLVKLIKAGSYKTPSVYEVVEKDLLKSLQIDVEEQRREAIHFAERFQAGNYKPDNKSDTVGSRKKRVDSIQDEEFRNDSSMTEPPLSATALELATSNTKLESNKEPSVAPSMGCKDVVPSSYDDSYSRMMDERYGKKCRLNER